MSRILIVDDEPSILRLVGAVLTRAGHDPVPAVDARTALLAIDAGAIDAAILDLGLPDRDGLELIAAIRLRSTAPILILSARDATDEKIAALDLGADDYVTKPFDGDELLARLRSALRRAGLQDMHDGVMRHGPIALDRARHRMTLNDEPVPLTRREFAVLAMLVEAGGRILTHKQILRGVWGAAHESDVEYLRVVVRALRLKVEQDPARPQLIRNEPGIGYRLAAETHTG